MSRSATNTPTSTSRGHLLDVSSDVAWRYKAYGAYGGNRATAIRAIRRKCPAFTPRQYSNAFARALELYDAVDAFVQQHESELWDAHNAGESSLPKHLDVKLSARFPGFRRSTIRSLIGMMFYYWQMR